MAQAIFKSWFVTSIPSAPGRRREACRSHAATRRLLPDSFEESELGEIPKVEGVNVVSTFG